MKTTPKNKNGLLDLTSALRLLAATGLGILAPQQSFAANQPEAMLFRLAAYDQVSASAPVLTPVLPYDFRVRAYGFTPGAYSTLQVTLATTGVFDLDPQSDNGGTSDKWKFTENFQSLAGLNATCPVSTASALYNLSFISSSGTTLGIPLSIKSLTFPVVPTVTNYSACQAIVTTSPFAVAWSAFTGALANDRIVFTVQSTGGYTFIETPKASDIAALAGTARGYTIPAKSLPPGVDLTAQVFFFREDSRGTTGGVPYASGACSQTTLNFHTAGVVDTTLPVVSSSIPANNATGVASTAALAITFNESMRNNGYSLSISPTTVDPSLVSLTWISLNQLRIAPPPGGWPKNTKITFTLNPLGSTATLFKDLSGNALASKIIAFTTGSL